MCYLTVDGMLSGTGIRDTVEGNHVDLSELALPAELEGRVSLLTSGARFGSFPPTECAVKAPTEEKTTSGRS